MEDRKLSVRSKFFWGEAEVVDGWGGGGNSERGLKLGGGG